MVPVVLMAMAIAAALVGVTSSAFSSTAGNSGSSFATAASFGGSCNNTPISTEWLSGMEHAMDSVSGTGIWFGTAGTASFDSVVKRNGAYSLRLAPNAAVTYRSRSWATSRGMTWRFALRLDSLPTGDVTSLFGADALIGGQKLHLGYSASANKLTLQLPANAAVQSTMTISAGTWYVIDLRLNTSANPFVADWRVNGVAQPSTSIAGTPTEVSNYWFGTKATTDTYAANYDDVVATGSAADYPIGDGKVLASKPNGMGTHSSPGNFQNDDGTAIEASSWMRIDDVPMAVGTDFIKQVATSTTSYVELAMEDTAETCVRAVLGRLVYDPLNTNQANNGKALVRDGTTETTVYSGNMASNTIVRQAKFAIVNPASSPWTPAALNVLTMRIGYSSDASPAPQWHALMLEYEAPR